MTYRPRSRIGPITKRVLRGVARRETHSEPRLDLTGVAYIHAAGGDPASAPVPLVFLGLLIASYLLRSKRDEAGAAVSATPVRAAA